MAARSPKSPETSPSPAPADRTRTAPPAAAPGDELALKRVEPAAEDAPLDSDALPRRVLEQFSDIRFLGRGGMGTVYRARDKQLHRDVVLKVVHRHDLLATARVLREARAQARVEHEHVCKIHEVSVAEGRPYIVMEYVDGAPLSEMRGRLTVEEKVKAIREAASALHEAHRLGLVHRDVKPSNILVQSLEDGTWKPYVMDFGLARDAGEQGLTMTGGVAGTPAFMAPEQARGEGLVLDRRTDVYGLGATLYDLLAGHPPFAEESAAQILRRLLDEDPPPLRDAWPAAPEDLDKIVMKCLEREPPRRYESARALAEDLQRYLDGEPVSARRASLGYVLAKRARKHKVLLSLSSLVLVAAIALIGGWVRARRLAAEEARLARELGGDVKEMELFMRYAYALPLHDVGRERGEVRRRLAEIERTMSAAGHAGEGPGNDALGRGYLALGEPGKALERLRRASAAGYASPELEYALGLSLVELYKAAQEELRRIEDPDKRAARQKELDRDYRDPALVHLEAARGARLEQPAYVEGLIALMEGRYDEALEKAREAQGAAPWLYEAKVLEGDIHVAQGDRWRPDAEFDNEKMMQHYQPALDAYRSATDVGRSDPAVHERACDLWIQIIQAKPLVGESAKQSFEEAKSSCGRAIEASPETSAAYVKRAWAYATFATGAILDNPHPQKAISEAIEESEQAARRSPDDAFAHYLVGLAWGNACWRAGNDGGDIRSFADRSIAGYSEAIRLDPGFLWAVREAADRHINNGLDESMRGLDPGSSFDRGRELLDRADHIAPGFVYNHYSRAVLHQYMARHSLSTGRNPAVDVANSIEELGIVIEKGPDQCDLHVLVVSLHVLAARYALASGSDPRPSLEAADRSLRARRCSQPSPEKGVGAMHATEALAALERGEDPEPALRKAREVLQGNIQHFPKDVEFCVELAKAELTGIRWAMSKHKVTAERFEAAFSPLRPLLEQDGVDPAPYQAMAEVHERRAAWLLEGGKDPTDDLSQGLAMADKALSKNPHMATAHATKGLLHLLSARRARATDARHDAAGRAKEALSVAFKENPLLERAYAAAREEAERLGE